MLVISAAAVLWVSQRPPRVERIAPATVAAGETVTVEGSGFGTEGRLAVDEVSVPAASIRRWTGQLIVFTVPQSMRSGLLRVHTRNGSSNPEFVTVAGDLPERVDDTGVEVASVEPETAAVGDLVVMSGEGFGPRSAMASLTLSAPDGDATLSASDPAVLVWSDREIRLVVPAAISPGMHRVVVNGADTSRDLTVEPLLAQRQLGDPRQFAVRMAVAAAGADEQLYTLLPLPPEFSEQPNTQLLRESSPSEPSMLGRAAVYRFQPPQPPESGEDTAGDGESAPQRIERVVLAERRSVRWTVESDHRSDILLEPWFHDAYRRYLDESDGVPVAAAEVVSLRRRIELSRPVYAIVRQIQATVIASLEPDVAGVDDPVAILASEEPPAASSRAYATLAVALARGSGVPARRHFGLVVDDTGQAIPHVWAEFFVPGIGWIPADPAVGDGILTDRAASLVAFYGDDPATGAIGALDDRRVTLSVDGSGAARLFPLGGEVLPERSWAPGILRVERPERSIPEGVEVRWEPPVLFGWFD